MLSAVINYLVSYKEIQWNSATFQEYLRDALSAVHPSVGTDAFIYWHSIIPTCLDVDQEEHVCHGFDNSVI